jgi:hypothetical protein
VALTEKYRNAIYQQLAPQWGDDVTQAFLSQFPARDGEEPITRDHLRAEFAEVRTEMAEMSGQLRSEMAELRGELRSELHQLGSRLSGLIIGVASVLAAVVAIATGIVLAVD